MIKSTLKSTAATEEWHYQKSTTTINYLLLPLFGVVALPIKVYGFRRNETTVKPAACSRFESLIESHHFRKVACECNEEDMNDDDDLGLGASRQPAGSGFRV